MNIFKYIIDKLYNYRLDYDIKQTIRGKNKNYAYPSNKKLIELIGDMVRIRSKATSTTAATGDKPRIIFAENLVTISKISSSSNATFYLDFINRMLTKYHYGVKYDAFIKKLEDQYLIEIKLKNKNIFLEYLDRIWELLINFSLTKQGFVFFLTVIIIIILMIVGYFVFKL